MTDGDFAPNFEDIQRKILHDEFELSKHAVDRSILRRIRVYEIKEAIATGTVIESYPTDKYGPSCLISGKTQAERALHIQCSYPTRPLIKIITLYEPDLKYGMTTSKPEGVKNMTYDWQENLVEKRITYTLELDGQFILIENVPARVNEETGEQFFSPSTVEALQKMVLDQQVPHHLIETPVYRYAS